MRLLKREFDNFESANYWVAGLSKAINTTYIPSGSTIEEVYACFLKIQLGRSFSDCGFDSAGLEMSFHEKAITIEYNCTSGTYVFLQYYFSDRMEFKSGIVECHLPDDQVGGCHYETITQLIYDYKWSKDGEVVVPLELMSLNPDGTEFPTPTWVLDSLAKSKRKEFNMETKTIKLVSHNFQAEFFIQVKGANTEQLIAEGKEQSYWRVLYNYLKSSEFPWKLGAQGRALDLSDNIRGICTSDFIVWTTSVLTDCWIYQRGEQFVHDAGAVEEIVT